MIKKIENETRPEGRVSPEQASCDFQEKITEAKAKHIPVLLNEVLEAMKPTDGQIYVDGTFGAGGYSRALLEAAQCTVYAIDRDPNVVALADKMTQAFPGRFFLLMGTFGDMVELLAERGIASIDGIVLDIGVSSMQIDTPERGFSFRTDGPLDMRMSASGQSAADLINYAEEDELADIFYHYGEERRARQVARAIVKARESGPIIRTSQLAQIIRSVVKGGEIDPATRTFQGLRIKVNDELGELERALESSGKLLNGGGKLVVVTFHSLEDRIVKQFLQSRSGETRGGSRHLPQAGETRIAAAGRLPIFLLDRKKPVTATPDELRANPRARSAKLRSAVRTETAA